MRSRRTQPRPRSQPAPGDRGRGRRGATGGGRGREVVTREPRLLPAATPRRRRYGNRRRTGWNTRTGDETRGPARTDRRRTATPATMLSHIAPTAFPGRNPPGTSSLLRVGIAPDGLDR